MNYVIAHKWNPDDPDSNLGIYSFFGDVQTGTLEEAQEMLGYVKKMSRDKQWDIYQVSFTKLEL